MSTEEAKKERPKFEVLAIAAKQMFLTVCDEKKWNTEAVFALQVMRSNPVYWDKVANENPQSITNAVTNVALTGTTLNPALQQAFLIPRKVNQKMTACLDHSYRGLCQIAVGAGAVIDMDADVVYTNDHFNYVRGLNPVLEHIPFSMRRDLTPEEREKGKGAMVYVYATAILPFGSSRHTKFIVLDREEVEAIRRMSQAPDSPMWKNHYGEGARKTAIKKLYKLLPQTDRMSIAIAQLNEFEGIDFEDQKKRAKSNVMERFNEEPVVEAEVEESGPDLCPSCQKLRVEGKCHNISCPEGVQPE